MVTLLTCQTFQHKGPMGLQMPGHRDFLLRIEHFKECSTYSC